MTATAPWYTAFWLLLMPTGAAVITFNTAANASVQLGAGRQKADDQVDFAVGFSAIKKVGEDVDLDEPLLMMHARNERSIVNILQMLEKAVEVG